MQSSPADTICIADVSFKSRCPKRQENHDLTRKTHEDNLLICAPRIADNMCVLFSACKCMGFRMALSIQKLLKFDDDIQHEEAADRFQFYFFIFFVNHPFCALWTTKVLDFWQLHWPFNIMKFKLFGSFVSSWVASSQALGPIRDSGVATKRVHTKKTYEFA